MIADYIGSNDTEHHLTGYTLSTGIVILLLYAVFAFNCYHLYQAKILEGVKSYSYSYEKTENKQDKQSEPEVKM